MGYISGPQSDQAYWIHQRLFGKDFAEKIDRIKAAFPKRNRTTPVVCPVTSEPVTHPYGLSERAWQLIKLGLDYEEQERGLAADRRRYMLSHWCFAYVPILEPGGNHHDHGLQFYDFKDMLALVGFGGMSTTRRLSEMALADAEAAGATWLHKENRKASDHKVYVVDLSEREAKALGKYIDDTQWHLQRAVDSAFSVGKSWLTAMASGTVSIDRINQLAAEQGKRGQT